MINFNIDIKNSIKIKQQINKNKRKQNVSFKAHPDYIKLTKMYEEINASSFFRRGPYYGKPNKNFQDIVDLFQKIFSKKLEKPQKMLVAGIGESQEPFSYLAVIKNLIQNKRLADVIDLNILDLQSKPSTQKLFKNSYFEFNREPDFVPSSFIKEITDISTENYRVNDEIFNYLDNTYKTKNKSFWETPLQDGVKNFPSESFDIVSVNNTLGYIEQTKKNETLQNIHRILKKEGFFITDPFFKDLIDANLLDKLEFIAMGVFKKIK